ncbi:Hypothetical_protein [Hexamita inflata]|uniref:Hypothetical_protein n=1 Tax=Hexamita inflata TaxID=28002 RepID=A0AA86P2K6_9EUKA|nr:Hypothetical protein HINF_LOCUS17096 [Hexamita inflata]
MNSLESLLLTHSHCKSLNDFRQCVVDYLQGYEFHVEQFTSKADFSLHFNGAMIQFKVSLLFIQADQLQKQLLRRTNHLLSVIQFMDLQNDFQMKNAICESKGLLFSQMESFKELFEGMCDLGGEMMDRQNQRETSAEEREIIKQITSLRDEFEINGMKTIGNQRFMKG